MIVGGGSNFVLLKTVLLCSGLATKSRPSQTFFLVHFHMDAQRQMSLFIWKPPLPLYVVS